MSMSMLVTLLCGFASKLDPDEAVIGGGTLGWTLIISNFIIVLLVLSLELIRRVLSIYRGVRSGISYIENTGVTSAVSNTKSFDGQFRKSAEDESLPATVLMYPSSEYPDARVIHNKLVEMGITANLCQLYGAEVEQGILHVAAKTYSSTLHAHLLSFETCPVEVTEFCRTLITGLTTLHAMEISHGNIRPETVLIDAGSIVLSEFSESRTVDDVHAPEFTMDAKMLASTILFTLSGGLTRAISDCHFSVQLNHFIQVFRS